MRGSSGTPPRSALMRAAALPSFQKRPEAATNASVPVLEAKKTSGERGCRGGRLSGEDFVRGQI